MDEPFPTPAVPAAYAPLSATSLIATGFDAVVARWPQALGLWAAGAALALGGRELRTWAHLGRVRFSPEWFGTMALTAAAAAVLAAMTLRLFLVSGRDWWRPDRRAWACAGLLAAASLASSAIGLIALGKPAPGHDVAGLEMRIISSFLNLGAQILLWWVFARLLLWPIGVLMGDAAMTPARSWRLMAGQVAGFVGAVILISLPLGFLLPIYMVSGRLAQGAPDLDGFRDIGIVTSVVSPALMVLQRAMAAAVYRARTGSHGAAGPSTTSTWPSRSTKR